MMRECRNIGCNHEKKGLCNNLVPCDGRAELFSEEDRCQINHCEICTNPYCKDRQNGSSRQQR